MRLVVFDCDGTLLDSQNIICAAMQRTFQTVGHDWPGRAATLAIVGLSLPQAMQRLAPGAGDTTWAAMGEAYKHSFHELRQDPARREPLFAGTREIIDALHASENVLLAIATGKSQRGVRAVLDREGWHGRFISIQTADDAPSKPHPAMVHQAMGEAGVTARDTVVVGDTTYDMAMARAAGAGAIGVSWGYHEPAALRLHGSHAIIDHFDQLPGEMDKLWSTGW